MSTDFCCNPEPSPLGATTDACTCSHCLRTYKSPSQLVCSGERVLCASCYERLIDPFPRLCCSGAAF
jgi:hypothetical protein